MIPAEMSWGTIGTSTTWRQAVLWVTDADSPSDHAVVEMSDDRTHDDERWVLVVDGYGHKAVDIVMQAWVSAGVVDADAERISAQQANAVTSLPLWRMHHRLRQVQTSLDEAADPF